MHSSQDENVHPLQYKNAHTLQDENVLLSQDETSSIVGTSLSYNISLTSTDEKSSSSSEDIVMHEFDEDSNDTDTFSEEFCENKFNEIDKTMMFEAANLTIHDVVMMVTGICLRYNLSYSAKAAILELVKILAGPKFTGWNISNYMISNLYSPPNDEVLYIFYCSKCYIKLIDPITKKDFRRQTLVCHKCKDQYNISMQSSNFFSYIDITYQITILLQNKEILSKLLANLELIDKNINSENSAMCDIYNGELYNKIYYIKTAECKILTINFNTDGAALFHSSKLSLLPIQLIYK